MQSQPDPFQFSDKQAAQELKKDPKYTRFLDWCIQQGMNLERINYPSAYGPSGLLVGVGTNQQLKKGDWILRTPCSTRTDYETIRNSSGVGEIIKALDVNQDYTLALFYMHQLLLGTESHLYHAISVSAPADLPFQWTEEEIEFIQDTQAIGLIKRLRVQCLQEADEIYGKVMEHGCVDKFCPGEHTKENFVKQYFQAWSMTQSRLISFGFNLKYYSMLPMIDSMNHHTAKETSIWQVVDSEGKILTQNSTANLSCYCIPGFEAVNGPQYLPPSEQVLETIISEVPIGIVEDTTAYFVPPEGSFFQIVSAQDLEEGEQIPCSYGDMSNRYHFVNYGFFLRNNKSDCFSIKLKISGKEKIILLHKNNRLDKFLASCKQVFNDAGLNTCNYSLVCQLAIELIKQQYLIDFGNSLDDAEEPIEEFESNRKRTAYEYRTEQRKLYQEHVDELQKLIVSKNNTLFN
ncbi:UNKNOWN [Stylonychia lemnae]|uniref:SET domain-containing protein n=1 Tax=Stylonychia lemnae TaxID=5949 RepID=A0A078AI92_STYLE|nr:UNKNOWN [Stylonychia lemnae]|eukprot:CDW80523.1 UNKNOWN [Stylonychia lemnae]